MPGTKTSGISMMQSRAEAIIARRNPASSSHRGSIAAEDHPSSRPAPAIGGLHMPLPRVPAVSLAAVTLALVTLAAPMTLAQQAADPVGNPERGKIVFRTPGLCVDCHGWAADGKTGVNLRAPAGPSLRETTLDKAALIEVIKCGRPGTPMPYHDRAAYRDDRCYGMTMSDFDSGNKPKRGKSLGDDDVADVVAYLQTHVIGLGKPTLEECAAFFDNPAAKACNSLRP